MDFEFKNQRKRVDFGSLSTGTVFISDVTFPGEPCMAVAEEDRLKAIHLLSGEPFSPDHFEQVIPYKATLVLE